MEQVADTWLDRASVRAGYLFEKAIFPALGKSLEMGLAMLTWLNGWIMYIMYYLLTRIPRLILSNLKIFIFLLFVFRPSLVVDTVVWALMCYLRMTKWNHYIGWFLETTINTPEPVIHTTPLQEETWFYSDWVTTETLLVSLAGAVLFLLWSLFVMFLVVIYLVCKPNKIRRMCGHGYMVEKAMEGSVPVNTPSPDFVAEIWVQMPGLFSTKVRSQTAVRVGDKILTTAHGLAGAAKIYLRYEGKEREITETPKMLEDDLVWVSYTPFSDFSMGAGKLAKYSSNQYCCAHNGRLQTYGRLSNSTVLGYVNYSGTTLPGFSGCPYYSNKTIFGIHRGSGAINDGYDAAYIHALLTQAPKKESVGFSTDVQEIFKELTEQAGALEYRRTANDYYVIKIGGRYQTYGEEEFEAAFSRFNKKKSVDPELNLEADFAQIKKYLAEQAKALEVPVVQRPEPVPVVAAATSFQDAENYKRTSVPAMQEAGPCLKQEESVVLPNSEQLGGQTDLKLLEDLGKTKAGLIFLRALRSAVSRCTSDDLQNWTTLTRTMSLSTPELLALKRLMISES